MAKGRLNHYASTENGQVLHATALISRARHRKVHAKKLFVQPIAEAMLFIRRVLKLFVSLEDYSSFFLQEFTIYILQCRFNECNILTHLGNLL